MTPLKPRKPVVDIGMPLPFAGAAPTGSSGSKTPGPQGGTTQSSLYDLWKNDPSPGNTAAILADLGPTLDRGIHMQLGPGNHSPIMVSKAKIMALNALKSFDPSRASLNTHVTNALQGLKRHNRRRQQAVYVPERLSLQAAMIQRAQADLEEELFREPTDEELLDRMGITEKRLQQIRKSQMSTINEGQLQQAMQNAGDGDGSISLPAVQARNDMMLKIVYSGLSDSNKKLMEWTFGMNGQRPRDNNEIARRLGITPGAVSQRRQTIQKQLDEVQGLKDFRDS